MPAVVVVGGVIVFPWVFTLWMSLQGLEGRKRAVTGSSASSSASPTLTDARFHRGHTAHTSFTPCWR